MKCQIQNSVSKGGWGGVGWVVVKDYGVVFEASGLFALDRDHGAKPPEAQTKHSFYKVDYFVCVCVWWGAGI